MRNRDMPAFPPNAGWEHSEAKGLTKREVVIKDFMAAMLSNYCGASKEKADGESHPYIIPDEKIIYSTASKCADTMFDELEKETK